jgi:effector-binding domain-containing protein
MAYDVQRIEMEPQPTAVIRAEVGLEGIAEFLGGAFAEVVTTLAEQGLSPDGPPFARYEQVPGGFRIEAGFPSSAEVEPVGRVERAAHPGGHVLVVLHRGPYGEVDRAYAAAERWMVDNEWEPAGEPWEAYLDGPEVAEPRTVVHIPARPV